MSTNNQPTVDENTSIGFIYNEDGIATDMVITHPTAEGVSTQFSLQELINEHVVAFLTSTDGQTMLNGMLAQQKALKDRGRLKAFVSTSDLETFFDSPQGSTMITKMLQEVVDNNRIIEALTQTAGSSPIAPSVARAPAPSPSPATRTSLMTPANERKRKARPGISEEKAYVKTVSNNEKATQATPSASSTWKKTPHTGSSSKSTILPQLVNHWFCFDESFAAALKEEGFDYRSSKDLQVDLALMCFDVHKCYSRSPYKASYIRKYKGIVGRKLGVLTRPQAQLFTQCKIGQKPDPHTAQNLVCYHDLILQIAAKIQLPLTDVFDALASFADDGEGASSFTEGQSSAGWGVATEDSVDEGRGGQWSIGHRETASGGHSTFDQEAAHNVVVAVLAC